MKAAELVSANNWLQVYTIYLEPITINIDIKNESNSGGEHKKN